MGRIASADKRPVSIFSRDPSTPTLVRVNYSAFTVEKLKYKIAALRSVLRLRGVHLS